MNQPVFGSLSILNENELSEQELQEFDNMFCSPFRNLVRIKMSGLPAGVSESIWKNAGNGCSLCLRWYEFTY